MSDNLGKGLGALLGENATANPEVKAKIIKENNCLKINDLSPSDVQPRSQFDDDALVQLANSIKEQGVLQPLLVRQSKKDGVKYEIIAGERRWRASKLAGLTEVPVIIKELTDEKALEVALVENIQRRDLNVIEEAEGYLQLINQFNYTNNDIARVTGKSASHISNLMRLLALPSFIKEMVSSQDISMGHARALLPLQDYDLQKRTALQIVKEGLSVRAVEKLVSEILEKKDYKAEVARRRTRMVKDPATIELEKRLIDTIGFKTSIAQKEGSGSLKIDFKSQTELKEILGILGL
ncbi:MAG: ParB/RepB/Spo0J family partition protein [Proteobacteria bacterium]|nr:ParB/RepB/Spo0J family partition protein [Pseudomonadota bacterium]